MDSKQNCWVLQFPILEILKMGYSTDAHEYMQRYILLGCWLPSCSSGQKGKWVWQSKGETSHKEPSTTTCCVFNPAEVFQMMAENWAMCHDSCHSGRSVVVMPSTFPNLYWSDSKTQARSKSFVFRSWNKIHCPDVMHACRPAFQS